MAHRVLGCALLLGVLLLTMVGAAGPDPDEGGPAGARRAVAAPLADNGSDNGLVEFDNAEVGLDNAEGDDTSAEDPSDRLDIPIIEPTDDPKSFLFNPTGDAVAVGGAVTWINSGRREHRALAEDGSFNSGPIPPGGRWTLSPSAPGVIAYFCPLHPEMRGTLRVRGDARAGAAAPGSGDRARGPAAPVAAAPPAPPPSAPREVGPSPTGMAPRAGGLPLAAALPLILGGLASLLAGGTLLWQDLRAARPGVRAPAAEMPAAAPIAAVGPPPGGRGRLRLDATGRCSAADPSAAALLGRPAADLRGRELAGLLGIGAAWSAEERARFVADGYWRGERAVRRADGTPAMLAVRVEASLGGRRAGYEIELAMPVLALSDRARSPRRESGAPKP